MHMVHPGVSGSVALDDTARVGMGKRRAAPRSPHQGHPGLRYSIFLCIAVGTLSLLGISMWRGLAAHKSLGIRHRQHSVGGRRSAGFLGEAVTEGRGAAPDAPLVVFAVSVTNLDGPEARSMLDAADVLANSIRRACTFSVYRCELVAFVLPSLSGHDRRQLGLVGWEVLERDLPVAVADIENDFYRGHVVKSGCCGANEFLKLHAYTLTQAHRVVHLDVDTLLLHPIDELMESEASLVFTTDPAMAVPQSKAMPVQGGFLLVRPDLAVYEKLRAIIRKGNWKIGQGWEGSKIGYFYGGATVQGLLPYFYNVIAPGNATEVNRMDGILIQLHKIFGAFLAGSSVGKWGLSEETCECVEEGQLFKCAVQQTCVAEAPMYHCTFREAICQKKWDRESVLVMYRGSRPMAAATETPDTEVSAKTEETVLHAVLSILKMICA